MKESVYKIKSVKIKNLLWMTEDLNLDDGGEGIAHKDGHFYYTIKAAKRLAKFIGKGWRLPKYEEFRTAIFATNGKKDDHSCNVYNTYTFRDKLKMKMGSGSSTIDYMDFKATRSVPVRVFYVGKKDPDPKHRVNVYWTGNRPHSPNGLPNCPATTAVWFDDDTLGKMWSHCVYLKNNFYSIRLVKDI